MDRSVEKYIKKSLVKIGGWFAPEAAQIISTINDLQNDEAISGDFCEIGLHHGRIFGLFTHLAKSDEELVGIDLFELQEQNVDLSGCGSKAIVENTIAKYGNSSTTSHLITADSTTLTKEDIVLHNKFRLFSIDGGHTADITYSDLVLAVSTICEGGVIVIDDYFNEAWPGVSEGVIRYMNENGNLFPIAIGSNKYLFTNSESAAQKYRNVLIEKSRTMELLTKESEAFGKPVIVLSKPRNMLKYRVKKLLGRA